MTEMRDLMNMIDAVDAYDADHYRHESKEMAFRLMHKMCTHLKALLHEIKDMDEPLEPWVADKLSRAASFVETIHNYLVFDGQVDELTEAMITEDDWEPTNKELWKKAQDWARKTYKVHPSAYSNSGAAKWYKREGGKWRKKTKESVSENLRQWHKEEWVDISRKVNGKHPPCGDSAEKGRRKSDNEAAYPKCVPASKARSMSKKEKESATRRKREVERSPGGGSKKPNHVSTKPKK